MTRKRKKAPKGQTNRRNKVIPERMDELNKQLKERADHIVKSPKRGERVGKYLSLDMKRVYKLAFMGMDDIELAQFLGISVDAFRAWQDEKSDSFKPELVEALYRGREGAISDVSDALRRRAKGYRHKQTVHFVTEKGIVSKETIKQYPPDYASAAFILKNKRPKDWQDKQVIDNPSSVPTQTIVNVVTDPETIKKLMKAKHEKQADNKKK